MAGKKRKERAKALKKLKLKRPVDANGRPEKKRKATPDAPDGGAPEADALLGVAAAGTLYLVDEARGVAYAAERVAGRLKRVGRWDAAARTVVLDGGARVAIPPSAAAAPAEAAVLAPPPAVPVAPAPDCALRFDALAPEARAAFWRAVAAEPDLADGVAAALASVEPTRSTPRASKAERRKAKKRAAAAPPGQ